MIDAEKWVGELTRKLLSSFGEKLIFVGFQGSYRRKEATEESDIDIVTVLDGLNLDDLEKYRDIISTMPEREKACGFIVGRGELMNWPKHEIFQMERDTTAIYGSMDGLLPQVSQADIAESARVSASALYHALCHTYIYGSEEEKSQVLKSAYKSAFFILQLVYYLESGMYCGTKAELLARLGGKERALLETGIEIKNNGLGSYFDIDRHFDMLIAWAGEVISNAARTGR